MEKGIDLESAVLSVEALLGEPVSVENRRSDSAHLN
jgi:hypothetical protein